MSRFESFVVLVVWLQISAVVLSENSPQKKESPRNRVIKVFNESAPKVGDPLPNITAFDANGKPFPLSSLKGRYTVLVFGCLT